MLCIVLLVLAVFIIACLGFRYISLIYAIQKIQKDLEDIQQDFSQNQMLRLPIPNRHLADLLCAFNTALAGLQQERLSYEQRERDFQKQIENVSHDLRTPLTVILGYLKLYKKAQAARLRGDRELSETISLIEQKAEVMKQLVTQFYDFSRITARDYDVTLTTIDIARLLREFILQNYQLLEETELQIEIEIPERPVLLFGDKSALERIFLNLFQNAGRYANSFFRIRLREEPKKVSILFFNDTTVISEDDIPHLFERFYLPDPARSQGGTGLGLTISKSLAEEMHGALGAKICSPPLPFDIDTDKTIICFCLEFPTIS